MGLHIRTIVVAVDFSETSNHAIDAAIDLAAVTKATIHLVHTYQLPVYGFLDASFVTPPELAAQLAEVAEESLTRLVSELTKRGVIVQKSLREGGAAEEIVAAAKELGADVIVLGTHGRRGISHVLLGSVAERVVRTSPVPVLTIRG